MRVIDEKEIRTLRRKKSVTNANGKHLKSIISMRKPRMSISPEEQQAISPEEQQAISLENLVKEIALLLQANNKNTVIFAQLIRKMNIQLPAWPKQITEWKHTIIGRDDNGKAKDMVSKAVM